MKHVVGAAGDAAQFRVLDNFRRPQRWIQNREIESDFVQALVQQLREGGGRAVERVFRGHCPPWRPHHPRLMPLCRRRAIPSLTPVVVGAARCKAFGHSCAADFLHVIEHRRDVLDGMSVGIDHRMIEACTNLCGFRKRAHKRLLSCASEASAGLDSPNGCQGTHAPHRAPAGPGRSPRWPACSTCPVPRLRGWRIVLGSEVIAASFRHLVPRTSSV